MFISRGELCTVWLVVIAVLSGCGRRGIEVEEPVSLTPAQEAEVKEYAAILDQQIRLTEQTVAVLATVQDDSATKDAARAKLVQLAVEGDLVERRLRSQLPSDVAVIVAARERLVQRQQDVGAKLYAEIQRINRMPGGEDFFQKELRPLLDSVKRR
jgi:hypothetical protein